MHILLKKINDKFVIEHNENDKPLYNAFLVNNGHEILFDENSFKCLLSEWQQQTKIIEFASDSEFHNTLKFKKIQ